MTDIQVRDAAPLAEIPPGSIPVAAMIQHAITSGVPVETIERLSALAERMRASDAKAAFDAAMARFKAICPPIPRNSVNPQFKRTIVGRDGVSRSEPSRFAALQDIEATIRKPLGDCGLSFRWGGLKVEGGFMTMECIVSHEQGHTVSSPVIMPVESRAGCSEQQKYGSAITYAQRYSLIQAFGLTTCDEDADGNQPKGETAKAGPTITEDQAANLGALLDEVKVSHDKFCKAYKIDRIADLPASEYKDAIARAEAKRGGK